MEGWFLSVFCIQPGKGAFLLILLLQCTTTTWVHDFCVNDRALQTSLCTRKFVHWQNVICSSLVTWPLNICLLILRVRTCEQNKIEQNKVLVLMFLIQHHVLCCWYFPCSPKILFWYTCGIIAKLHGKTVLVLFFFFNILCTSVFLLLIKCYYHA